MRIKSCVIMLAMAKYNAMGNPGKPRRKKVSYFFMLNIDRSVSVIFMDSN